MRVPMIAYGPGAIGRGRTVDDMVANLDIAPTILDLAVRAAVRMLLGYNYPSTPTTFAFRSDRCKLIQHRGVWDLEELYDVARDPLETRNLIADPALAPVVARMRRRLYERLADRGGRRAVSFTERLGAGSTFRNMQGVTAAEYPQMWLRSGTEGDPQAATRQEGGRRDAKR